MYCTRFCHLSYINIYHHLVIYPWTNQPLWPTWKAVAYRCALRDLHTLGEKILAISIPCIRANLTGNFTQFGRCMYRWCYMNNTLYIAISCMCSCKNSVIFGSITYRYVRYENVYCVISVFSNNYVYIISYLAVHEFRGNKVSSKT